jgi:hypothetical protein
MPLNVTKDNLPPYADEIDTIGVADAGCDCQCPSDALLVAPPAVNSMPTSFFPTTQLIPDLVPLSGYRPACWEFSFNLKKSFEYSSRAFFNIINKPYVKRLWR